MLRWAAAARPDTVPGAARVFLEQIEQFSTNRPWRQKVWGTPATLGAAGVPPAGYFAQALTPALRFFTIVYPGRIWFVTLISPASNGAVG